MPFKEGDIVQPKPRPPIRGKVLHVYDDGQLLIEWTSGIRAMASKPEELEVVADGE